MAKILVVEDNIDTQLLLAKFLAPHHEFRIVSDLGSAWTSIEQEDWGLIILDRSLPDGDGLELCVKLKKLNMDSKFPVLMLTAKGELDEKITGLTAGADDYMVKPFEPRELLARIEALYRRRNEGNGKNQSTLLFEKLLINTETHSVSILSDQGEPTAVDLTPIEYKILFALVKNYGKEIDRETLVKIIWDKVNLSERNIDTHVCHLRKKIASSQMSIKNRRGSGYYIKKSEPIAKPNNSPTTILPYLGRS